jgi:hypothetical protein
MSLDNVQPLPIPTPPKRPGAHVQHCAYCSGSGIVRGPKYGTDTNWICCDACFGSGEYVPPCPQCGGSGAVAGTVTRTTGLIFKRIETVIAGVTCPTCNGRKRVRNSEPAQ